MILTSADPAPPLHSIVRDDMGRRWMHVYGASNSYTYWINLDAEDEDPETWNKVAGNYGPVLLMRAPFSEEEAECSTCCDPDNVAERCPQSQRACGHHCNHVTDDSCHWCRAQWGEDGVITYPEEARRG